MKILFAGTSDFACESLRMLNGRHDVIGCITRADRPAGRGRKPRPSPVGMLGEQLGITVFQPEGRSELQSVVAEAGADVVAVVAYGVILPGEILEIPPMGCVNLHASLLPRYRGAAPINWAIVRGEKTTGVTAIRMTPQMDAGPVLGSVAIDIENNETAGELHDRLATAGAPLLADVIDAIGRGDANETAQDDSLATDAPMLTKDTGLIDWNITPENLHNFVRGMTPSPGAFTWLADDKGRKRLTILAVKIIDRSDSAPENTADSTAPGTVLSASDGALDIACSRGAVRILRLKPEGKKEMTAADFLRGRKQDISSLVLGP